MVHHQGDAVGEGTPLPWQPSESELRALLRIARASGRRVLGDRGRHLADDVAAATCLLLVTADRGLRNEVERHRWVARVAGRVALAMLADPDERMEPLTAEVSDERRVAPQDAARRDGRRRARLRALLPRLEPVLTAFQQQVLQGLLDSHPIRELARLFGVDPRTVRRAIVAIVRHARSLLARGCPRPPSCR